MTETLTVGSLRPAIELGEAFLANSGIKLTDEPAANSCAGIVLRLVLACRHTETQITLKDDQMERVAHWGNLMASRVVTLRDSIPDGSGLYRLGGLLAEALVYADMRPESEGGER